MRAANLRVFFFSNCLGFGYCVFHLELSVHHITVSVSISSVCFILILMKLSSPIFCVLPFSYHDKYAWLPNDVIVVALVYKALYFIGFSLATKNNFIKSVRTQYKCMQM